LSKFAARPTDLFKIVNPTTNIDLLRCFPNGEFTREDAERMRLLATTGALNLQPEALMLDRLMAMRRVVPMTETAPEMNLIPPSPEECVDKALDGLSPSERAVVLCDLLAGHYKHIAPLYKLSSDADIFRDIAGQKLRTGEDMLEVLSRTSSGELGMAWTQVDNFLKTFSEPLPDEAEPLILDQLNNQNHEDIKIPARLYTLLKWDRNRAEFMAERVYNPPAWGSNQAQIFLKALFRRVAKLT
jgi:hypothetical protein